MSPWSFSGEEGTAFTVPSHAYPFYHIVILDEHLSTLLRLERWESILYQLYKLRLAKPR
jgi:hypothetical protein